MKLHIKRYEDEIKESLAKGVTHSQSPKSAEMSNKV